MRQGDYRVIYGVDDEARTVVIVKIGHRRDVPATIGTYDPVQPSDE